MDTSVQGGRRRTIRRRDRTKKEGKPARRSSNQKERSSKDGEAKVEKKEKAKAMGRAEKEREKKSAILGTMVRVFAKAWQQAKSAKGR